jgi:hypothetical protein
MKETEEINQLNPLTVVDNVLKEASEWNLTAEVVLFALKIIKDNPDIDETKAMLISRDEWDVASQMQAERTHEQKTELDTPIDGLAFAKELDNQFKEADKALKEAKKAIVKRVSSHNEFSQHILPGGHEDIFNDDSDE